MLVNSRFIEQIQSPIRRRIGAFSISLTFLDDNPEVAIVILSGCAVMRAEAIWHTHQIDYVAMHSEFDAIPPDHDVPTYTFKLTRYANGEVTRSWERRQM